MAMNSLNVACCALVLGTLVGCGGDGDPASAVSTLKPGSKGQCESVEGSRYLSQSLQEIGLSVDGLAVGHWQLSLQDGVVESFQSDFGMTGTYTCRGNKVRGELNGVEFKFNAGADTIEFNPFAGAEPLLYILAPTEAAAACEQIAGQRFANNETSDFMAFAAEGQKVEFQLGERAGQGQFDCDLGELNFYFPAEPGSKPEPIALAADGGSLSVGALTLALEETTQYCTEQYEPVCGVVPGSVQCITTPCPSGLYQTFPNACYAERAGAINLKPGECGPLEGQPEQTPSCGPEDGPVCAAAQAVEPCLSAPCPTPVHQTFDCGASAAAAGARIVQESACDKLEGEPITAPLEGACTAQYDPVCALAKAPIACITEPCPSHAYQTYGNACTAALELAQVAFAGECGRLEGSVTFGQPPVWITPTLPVDSSAVNVVDATIEADVLTTTLTYSGCSPQHIALWIMDVFLESEPVQVGTALVPQEQQDCDAVQTATYSYDLRPLKTHYQAAYGTESGRIEIQQFGIYQF